MIAYVDGKPRSFTLVDGVRVWDDPSGIRPYVDGRWCLERKTRKPRRNKREDAR